MTFGNRHRISGFSGGGCHNRPMPLGHQRHSLSPPAYPPSPSRVRRGAENQRSRTVCEVSKVGLRAAYMHLLCTEPHGGREGLVS